MENETKTEKSTFHALLKAMVKHSASDLHLKPGRPPLFRVHGKLIPVNAAAVSEEEIKEFLVQHVGSEKLKELKLGRSIDSSFEFSELGRFRMNCFQQRGRLGAIVRRIHLQIPRLEQLNLPDVLQEIALARQGLILITGPTGSGKSTTQAAVLDFINERKSVHIITLEDPIEYVFVDKKSSISQREVGIDTENFSEGLHSALRQDPDIIALGELRSFEAVQVALQAAETGHLVVATLHTHDAVSALHRIFDIMPPEMINQTRALLANSLVGVIAQKLVPSIDKKSRLPICEVMTSTPTIREKIKDGKAEEIYPVIESSNTYYKMQTFNQALEALVSKGSITKEEALKASPRPDELDLRLSGLGKIA